MLSIAFVSRAAGYTDCTNGFDNHKAKWIGAITQADAHIPEGRSFSGGKLKGAEKLLWEAADTLSRRSIILTKTFKVRKHIQKAELKICGLGFYELSLNGKRVGDSMFAPLWSDYDKTVFYNIYDLTDILKNGKNTFEVLLGNGFYNEQGGRYAKMRISFGPPTLYFDLTVTYRNGKQEKMVSDASWTYRQSPITFNSIYGGEDYDARQEIVSNSFKRESMGKPVVIQEAPKGVLRKQIAEPVKIMEFFYAKDTIRHDSLLVLDMGQNLSGFPEILVSGTAGKRLKLTPGETLNDDGTVNQKQTGCPHYYLYILGGRKNLEKWHPHFSYYGYRYLQVEGDIETLKAVKSCFVYNSARKIGDFACSNSLFNETYRIIDRAIRSNWQAVWTDCPHREKLGWLEQDWLNGEGLVYNYDCRSMIEQTMQNIVDAQHADGSMPEIAPEYTIFKGLWAVPFLESPEWGGAIIALPMLYLRHYGDDTLVLRHYDAMKRYLDYLHTQDSCYILRQGLGDWYDYGEGRAGFSKNTPMPLVSTAHYYLWAKYMITAAKLVEKPADVAYFTQLTEQIAKAFHQNFYHSESQQYGTGSQCSNAIALEMGLVRNEDRQAVIAHLVDDIHAHGDRLTTGDVGNRYLMNALMNNGQQDLLYKMLNHDGVPGYGFQLKQGMTTLTEQWNPTHGASMNHFMMAHVNNLFIPVWTGIQVDGEYLTIAPSPVGDLTWCKGSTKVNGEKVSVVWKKDGETFSLDITTPQEADVKMPYSGKRITIGKGNHHLEEPIKN